MSKLTQCLLTHKMSKMSKGSQDCRLVQVDIPPRPTVDIEFTDITMTVTEGFRRKKKQILKGVSGLFKSGHLTAIMGPSGAGKSTLLNALTGFSTEGVKGTIRAGNQVCEFNGKHRENESLKNYRKKSCYILQDDRLNPLFTVAELMHFAADMKLGSTVPEDIKKTMIKEVLYKLGLCGTEETRCGNLSGGQKKRLSIAVELIDNPSVIYLDEPTTGLDSLTSAQCMMMLKTLARDGRTVVCTIHQPQASLYSMFDKVYILAEGMCIYNGPSEETVSYLASVGLQCPKYHNPADYVLEIATGEYGKFNEVLAKKATQLHQLEKPSQSDTTANPPLLCDKLTVIVNRPHELYKFGILFRRCLMQQYRDWTVTHLKVLLHMFIGVLLGLLFENAGTDASKTVSNLGFMLVSLVYLCYTSLMPAVLRYPLELSVLKKENFNNWYNLKTYYAAAVVTSVPIQIWFTFVYAVPSYFISSQPPEFFRFGMVVLTMAIVTLLADALGNVIGTCANPVNGTFIGAVTTCTLLLFCGFLVLFQHMHWFMRAVSNVSFLKTAYEAILLSLYSYGRQPLECPETKIYCHIRYPSELLKIFSMEGSYWNDIIVLAVELIVLRILAFFTLKRIIRKAT